MRRPRRVLLIGVAVLGAAIGWMVASLVVWLIARAWPWLLCLAAALILFRRLQRRLGFPERARRILEQI
jgi:uncharacterized membrane protein